MRRTINLFCLLGAIAPVVLTAGCGSSGGGSSSQGDRTVDVYVTDSFRDQFSHVQVTLYKIEASADGQAFQTLYEDADGLTIDLTSLADAAQLLGSVKAPEGDFNQVHVVFGDHLTLTPKAGGLSLSVPVEDHPPLVACAGGKCTVSLEAHTEKASEKLSNLVVDFDLGAFAMVSGHIRPSLRPGDPAEFQRKQHRARLIGVVANLSAAGFDLTSPNGARSLAIKLTETTSVSGASSGDDATLANGQTVHVEGALDKETHTLTAESVRVLDRALPGLLQIALGSVASVDSANQRFDLTIRHSLHLRPTADAIHVQTSADTKFHTPGRKAASFGDLAVAKNVAVVGTFDEGTQTLTAKRVELLPAGGP